MFVPLIKTSGHLAISGLQIERRGEVDSIKRKKHGFEDQGKLGSHGFLKCKSERSRTDLFRFRRFMGG